MQAFIHAVLNWLADLGYIGVALGLMIEVIPSEIVLAYGGYLVSQEKIGFVGTVIAGTIGGTLAQLFLYWIGYYGGRPFLTKYGKYLFITEKHVNLSEDWFNKYGTGVIFGARFIPVVRHAISIPAGIAGMSLRKFLLYTTLAIIPWSVFFIYLGIQLGHNYDHIKEKAAPYVQPIAIVACIALVLYFAWQRMKRKKK
ncbi:DedA family protein [Marininema halotolerans]|uniref:Membrane protein DedA, SNARE-associated domain n=1 Tax=Marininema halotolerans TaxID=1155944 RepID=A0A1I6RLB9_9BACL|nr:DedA family protein [Marininema halotolerans]SFS65446.1 membrane protein DedA, SNARE-associated domain [Marininema halotolerans]